MAIKFAKKVKSASTEPQATKKVTAGTIVEGGVQPKVTKATSAKKPTKVEKQSTVVSPTEVKAVIKPHAASLLKKKKAHTDANKVASGLKKAYDDEAKEVLTKVLESGLDPEAGIETTADGAKVTVTKAASTRSINSMQDVFDALKSVDEDLPWKLLGFKLTDIDKYLPKTVADKLVTVTQTDKRTLSVAEE